MACGGLSKVLGSGVCAQGVVASSRRGQEQQNCVGLSAGGVGRWRVELYAGRRSCAEMPCSVTLPPHPRCPSRLAPPCRCSTCYPACSAERAGHLGTQTRWVEAEGTASGLTVHEGTNTGVDGLKPSAFHRKQTSTPSELESLPAFLLPLTPPHPCLPYTCTTLPPDPDARCPCAAVHRCPACKRRWTACGRSWWTSTRKCPSTSRVGGWEGLCL